MLLQVISHVNCELLRIHCMGCPIISLDGWALPCFLGSAKSYLRALYWYRFDTGLIHGGIQSQTWLLASQAIFLVPRFSIPPTLVESIQHLAPDHPNMALEHRICICISNSQDGLDCKICHEFNFSVFLSRQYEVWISNFTFKILKKINRSNY